MLKTTNEISLAAALAVAISVLIATLFALNKSWNNERELSDQISQLHKAK